MSTSLLYHAFGVRGYIYEATEYQQGGILFRIRHNHKHLRCPVCNCRRVVRRGCVEREFRTVPIGGKPVVLRLRVQRVLCLECGALRQVHKSSPLDTPQLSWGEESGDSPEADHAVSME